MPTFPTNEPLRRNVPPTDTCLLDRRLHHAVVVVTEGESFRMDEARARIGGHAALM